LYGHDSYRRQEKLKEYLDRYKVKYSSFSCERFYIEEDGQFNALKEFAKSQSLFDSSRLGIIVGDLPEENKSERKELRQLLKDNLESKDLTLLLIWDKKPAADFSFLLKKPVVAEQFENLTGGEFSDFLQSEARKRGINLDKESQSLLAQVYNGDSWGLATELDKLSLFDERDITLSILKKHLQAAFSVNVFNEIRGLNYSRDFGERLGILEKLFSSGADSGKLFNLAAAFMNSPESKIKAADYDVAVKSGKLEYEEALISLVIE